MTSGKILFHERSRGSRELWFKRKRTRVCNYRRKKKRSGKKNKSTAKKARRGCYLVRRACKLGSRVVLPWWWDSCFAPCSRKKKGCCPRTWVACIPSYSGTRRQLGSPHKYKPPANLSAREIRSSSSCRNCWRLRCCPSWLGDRCEVKASCSRPGCTLVLWART